MDIGRNLRDLLEFKLRAMERAVAKEHLDKFPWFSLFWAVANANLDSHQHAGVCR